MILFELKNRIEEENMEEEVKKAELCYEGCYRLIERLGRCLRIKVWKNLNAYENNAEMGKLLIEPFLIKVFESVDIDRLQLEKVDNGDDDGFEVVLHRHKGNFYVTLFDEWECETTYLDSRGIREDDLFKALSKNSEFMKYVSLKDIDSDLKLEINRFCLDQVNSIFGETFSKGKKTRVLRCPNFDVRQMIYSELVANYDKYNKLALVATYYALIESDSLFDYIEKNISDIIQSRGFIKKYRDDAFLFIEDFEFIKSGDMDKVIKEGAITISNIEKKFLSKLKRDIVSFDIATVNFKLKDMFSDYEVESGAEGRSCDWTRYKLLHHWGELIRHKNTDIRELDSKKIDLLGTNILHYDVFVVPKVYGPAHKYLLEVKYHYMDSDRIMYLRDIKSEEILESDLVYSPIRIHHIKIFDEAERENI